MADYLVRAKQVYSTAGASVSATFSEATPLDNNYLLVAILQFTSASPPTAVMSGWTQLGPAYTGTGQALYVYACNGNNAINSFSCTHASGGKSLVQLLAFRGYASLTPISEIGNKSASVTTQTITSAAGSGYGVALAAMSVNGVVSWGSWSGGTLNPSDTGGVSIADSSQLMNNARAEFTGTAVTQTITWTTSRYDAYFSLVMPLMQEPVITTTSLNALKQWVPFSQTLAYSGGTPSLWTMSAGALPMGLSLNANTGQISGTPSGSGAYNFTITASNSAAFDVQVYTGTVTPTIREYYLKGGQSLTPYLRTSGGLTKLN